MPEPLVVVTGASGLVGTALVSAFGQEGVSVRAGVHHGQPPDRTNVESVRWNLGSPAGALLAGASTLVHAAFVAYDHPGASEANVRGTLRLIEEARAAGVARIVFLSSMAARPDAPSTYARDKWHVAQVLDRPGDLVVRPGLVLGNGGLFGRIWNFVATRRVVPLVGGGRQLVHTVFVSDLAAAIVDATLRGDVGTLTIAERTPVRFRRLLQELADLLGRRVLFVPVPATPIAAALQVAGAVGLRVPINSDNLAGLQAMRRENVIADLERIRVPIRDYRASLRTLVTAGDG